MITVTGAESSIIDKINQYNLYVPNQDALPIDYQTLCHKLEVEGLKMSIDRYSSKLLNKGLDNVSIHFLTAVEVGITLFYLEVWNPTVSIPIYLLTQTINTYIWDIKNVIRKIFGEKTSDQILLENHLKLYESKQLILIKDENAEIKMASFYFDKDKHSFIITQYDTDAITSPDINDWEPQENLTVIEDHYSDILDFF